MVRCFWELRDEADRSRNTWMYQEFWYSLRHFSRSASYNTFRPCIFHAVWDCCEKDFISKLLITFTQLGWNWVSGLTLTDNVITIYKITDFRWLLFCATNLHTASYEEKQMDGCICTKKHTCNIWYDRTCIGTLLLRGETVLVWSLLLDRTSNSEQGLWLLL